MNGRCFFVAWILMLGVCFPAKLSSQVDSSILAMADWVKAYNRFGKYNPQEKVYLHFLPPMWSPRRSCGPPR